MKYAVDRYILGHEQEVAAELFLSFSDIPRRKERFFCPECGETVFFRAKGDGEFYHQKQIEGTPECDKRVDGRSRLSLYERVGLSLYIVPETGERYGLGISFPPLGRQKLDIAAQQKTGVQIASHNEKRRFRVNFTRFSADQSTLLPVDFLPPAGENYRIEIQNAENISDIKQKWSDYADGFGIGGAFFHYGDGEEKGRKIRRGDSISPGKQYYLVTEQLYSPPYSEIQTERIGFIQLKSGEFTVSRFTVNVSTKDAARYALIDHYLRAKFGVWLLETTPELTTIWPPTILQQDAQVPVLAETRKLYCAVSSGNDHPNVYSYSDCGNSVSTQTVLENGVILLFYGSEMAASVDRKYIGREIFYRRGLRPSHDFSYEVYLEDSSGQRLDWKTLTQDALAKAYSVKANAKMEFIVGCKGNLYQRVKIRADHTPMPSLDDLQPKEVYFLVEDGVVLYYDTKKIMKTTEFYEDDFLAILKKQHAHGPLVPAPAWVAWVVRTFYQKGNITLAGLISSEVRGGKIPLGILKALFATKERIIGGDSK